MARAKLKKEEARKVVRDLPGVLAGRKPDRFGLHKAFWGAVAQSLFDSIYKAFLQKSELRPDDLGNTWDDITQHTKAYKRDVRQGGTASNIVSRRKRNLSRNKRTGERQGLGLLTATEFRRWKAIFGAVYHKNKDRMPDEELKAIAGQIAWTRLKEEGAQTMWEVLGTRNLLVLRNTDALGNSLRPGEFDPATGYHKGDRHQVFILRRGSIVIGTDIPYADQVSRRRPIWPEEIGPWLDRAVEAGRDALHARLQQILA